MEEWWARYRAGLDGTRTSAEDADIFSGSLEGWKVGRVGVPGYIDILGIGKLVDWGKCRPRIENANTRMSSS